jgi:NAD(P)-dependent dehydrogenase (short-subunit alcohol dehydrogenase family)
MRLKDKASLVTGAGSGIGREAALLFAKEGASVVAVDMNEAAGKAMMAAAKKAYGRLNVLFNNAGIFPANDGSVLETDEKTWDLVLSVNLKGVFLGCKYGIPLLLESGGGSIVNTASFVALMGSATPQVAYTASKGGVLALTREIAIEFARKGIRVNAICPGPVDTPLLQELFSDPARKARRLVHIPMGRLAQAKEVAQAALFLASDDSSYVNGTAFTVDGGITAAYTTPE